MRDLIEFWTLALLGFAFICGIGIAVNFTIGVVLIALTGGSF